MEANKTLCKICKELKLRIEDGKYGNGKDKRWRDELGKLWVGRICSNCNKIRAKEAMRKYRSEVNTKSKILPKN